MSIPRCLFVLTLVCLLPISAGAATEFAARDGVDLELVVEEEAPGLQNLFVESTSGGKRVSQPIGRTMAQAIELVASGIGPGALRWIRWEEDGQAYGAHSEDSGRSWSERRRFGVALRLKAGEVLAGHH